MKLLQCATLACTLSLLGACATTHLEPAIPAAHTGAEQPVSITEVPASGEMPVPPVPVQAPSLVSVVNTVPVSAMPVSMPTAQEWEQFQEANAPEPAPKKSKRQAEAETAKVIDQANTKARMAPTRQGYANDASVIQRYPYKPGVLYEIWTSLHTSTAIMLPPGERIMSAPLINEDAWNMAPVEAGEGAQRQEILLVRPKTVGLTADITLFTQSGLSFFCRLMSFEHTAMVAVSWMVPKRLPLIPEPAMPAEKPGMKPPQMDLSRLHRHYTMSYDEKRMPPWVPIAVFDDGQRTVIKFREPLSYTLAPVLFGSHGEKAPWVLQYSHYTMPGQPEKGAYYIITGLFPILELRGADGYHVRIVRQSPSMPHHAAR